MLLPPTAGTDGSLEVREWRSGDAAALVEAVRVSRGHLSRFMAWADEPPSSPAERAAQFRDWHEQRCEGGDASYGILIAGRPVGGCGLHGRLGPGGLEIGYWLRGDVTGRGIASAAVRLLIATAFAAAEIDRVEIHHDAANLASGAVPARLGFTLLGESPRPRLARGDSGVERRWRLTRADWPARRRDWPEGWSAPHDDGG